MAVVSDHAIIRLIDRLDGLVTQAEVVQALTRVPVRPQVGKTWILVKMLSQQVHSCGSTGDSVWAVYSKHSPKDPGIVSTLCLRGRAQRFPPNDRVIR